MTSMYSLLSEAESHPVEGWDFSWLGERLTTEPFPWSYEDRVIELAQRSPDLLDMGTGGGEWLSQLPSLPLRTIATEAWQPNVPLASALLAPLGASVVKVEPAPDNADQGPGDLRGRLPFRSDSFHLIINRHESFTALEVARVLAPAGTFLTQQLGGEGSYLEAYNLLGVDPPRQKSWNLAEAKKQVEFAGLTVTHSEEGVEVALFADAGAFAWYLRAIPWIVSNFEIGKYRDHLEHLHERIQKEGPFRLSMTGFWLEATKSAQI